MRHVLSVALVLGFALPAWTPAWATDLVIKNAFSRATPGGGPGVAYMTIQGGDVADRLVSVTSPRAAKAGLHSMITAGTVMRMRAVDAIEVPAGGMVVLAPNTSLHVMLEGLTTPLKTGERVPLVLHFEKAGDKAVDAVVGTPGQASMPGG